VKKSTRDEILGLWDALSCDDISTERLLATISDQIGVDYDVVASTVAHNRMKEAGK